MTALRFQTGGLVTVRDLYSEQMDLSKLVCYVFLAYMGKKVRPCNDQCCTAAARRSTKFLTMPLEGRPGISDVSPLSGISGLSFDSTLLSPLLFFCLVLVLFLSYLFFFCLLVHSVDLSKPDFKKVHKRNGQKQ